jgi:hypothetical protein
MSRKLFAWWFAGVTVFSSLLVSAGTPDSKSGTKTPAPAKVPEPSIYWWYKNETPYVGKEINRISVNVGEEIPVCVQALDSNGRDIGVCPVEFKADNTILSLSALPGKCNAVKIKGLKNSEVSLIAVFQGDKGKKIEAVLKGSVGSPVAPQQKAEPAKPATPPAKPQAGKPAPAPKHKP